MLHETILFLMTIFHTATKTSISKPMLEKFELSNKINLFQQTYMGGKVEPTSGPDKVELQCYNSSFKTVPYNIIFTLSLLLQSAADHCLQE